jgi:hypothetical protein
MNECRLVSNYSFMPQGKTGDSHKEANSGSIQKGKLNQDILMRKELTRENPSQGEGTETTVIHEDTTQWGAQKEMVDTFCLRGRPYMERSDTPTSAREMDPSWQDATNWGVTMLGIPTHLRGHLLGKHLSQPC